MCGICTCTSDFGCGNLKFVAVRRLRNPISDTGLKPGTSRNHPSAENHGTDDDPNFFSGLNLHTKVKILTEISQQPPDQN